ncbi:MAG TPA: hypothetical protein VEB86_09740, partial [Chryseosolibacter sp.]|nr:hypothetical protein [Chryseosolibacter sp.]
MKIRILAFFLLISSAATSQITTVSDGDWNNTAVWSCSCVPTSASGTITINHQIDIPSGFSVNIDQTTVSSSGKLTIENGGTLSLQSVTYALVVFGTVQADQGSTISNATGSNIAFGTGGTYIHNYTTQEGSIPRAVWNANSTMTIQGYTTFSSATATGNWSQSFGHVSWNCTSQANTVTLNGLLTTVRGNLNILNTAGRIVQLTTSTRAIVSVTGDVTVQGNSRFVVNTTSNGSGLVLNIGGDFNLQSTSSSSSLLTTTGNTTVNVAGDFNMNTPGSLYLSNTTNSTSVGTLNINGNFALTAGTITEGVNDGAGAKGRIVFVNTAGQGKLHSFTNSGTISNRIEYQLSSSADTLQLVGESQLIGHGSSSFTLSGGTLIVESTHAS